MHCKRGSVGSVCHGVAAISLSFSLSAVVIVSICSYDAPTETWRRIFTSDDRNSARLKYH